MSYPTSKTRRGRVQGGGEICPTIATTGELVVNMAYRIRKLTAKECLRLMGVSDEDTQKMKEAGISENQLYRLAGNSIVVPVLEGIFTQMFKVDRDELF